MFSKDADEVNDLFQDVLINLWRGFDGFRGESKVDTWIWRVALNTCISDERKKKRRGERVPLRLPPTSTRTRTMTASRFARCTPASTNSASWTAPLSCSGSKTSATTKSVPLWASLRKTFPSNSSESNNS